MGCLASGCSTVNNEKGTVNEMNYEAEEAQLTGATRVEKSIAGYSGEGYVTGFEGDGDRAVFTVEISDEGYYDIHFIFASLGGPKENIVTIDDKAQGTVSVEAETFTDSVLEKVYLEKGTHKIGLSKAWGWIALDKLVLTKTEPIDNSIYKVSGTLVNPNADEHARMLMKYLSDCYGKYTIAGQHSEGGFTGKEFVAIKKTTGKIPALLGLDFIEYSPSRVANGSTSKAVEKALQFNKQGGIIAFCWHWNAPEKYLYDTAQQPWWKGFYTEGTNIDLAAIMDGKDEEGYNLLISDMDEIAEKIKELEKAGVPILWRPLHEASGGWFWWGASGPEAYKKLYRLMYDRFTNVHKLNNLIWVWNGQHPDWYPGDDCVDIIGEDIYPGEKVYTSQTARFLKAYRCSTEPKLVALSENGCLMDPDLVDRDNNKWSYFMTWEGEFVTEGGLIIRLSEQYTEADMMKKVYADERVITFDELPDLKHYPLE